MSPAPTSTAAGVMTAGAGGGGAGAGSGGVVDASATGDGAVGVLLSVDPPQAEKATTQTAAAVRTSDRGSIVSRQSLARFDYLERRQLCACSTQGATLLPLIITIPQLCTKSSWAVKWLGDKAVG
jgi:hypothetical protein